MINKTIICLTWKLSGRIEVFTTLGKLYAYYNPETIGASVHTLTRKNLFAGWENDTIRITKLYINK